MNKQIKSNIRYAIIAILAFTANTAKAETTADSVKVSKQTLVLSATEMSCGTDRKMVETALYRKKGVKSVRIDGETITIVYNPEKIKPEELKSTVENTGTCEDPNAKVHKVEIKSKQ